MDSIRLDAGAAWRQLSPAQSWLWLICALSDNAECLLRGGATEP